MTFWYLFNSSIRKVNCINIIFEYLLFRITDKKINKKKVLFDFFNKS